VPRGGAGYLDQSLADAGRWSISISVLRSFDYEGGHPEDKGLSEDGQVIAVPLHEHSVSLDINRLELNLQYIFRRDWALRLFLPYEQKNQSVMVTPVETFTPEQWQAALRGGYIHHRDETYKGLSDGFLRVAFLWPALFSMEDQIVVSAGVSLPFGRTEDDPIRAGMAGEEHLHLQFGTGTYDPLLDVSYYLKLSKGYEVSLSAFGRFPTANNHHGYRGGQELSSQLGLSRNWKKGRLNFGLAGVRTGYANWSGERDLNTGLKAIDAQLGGAYSPRKGRTISLNLSIPLSQKNLAPGAESFEKGPTVYLGFAMPLPF